MARSAPRKAPRGPDKTSPRKLDATVDPAEVERFSALAEAWWNPDGPMRPLHKFNPVRLRFIRDALAGHFGRDAAKPRPLAGLTVLDIGCGGGLVCEPLARLGATVTGIDASEKNVRAAAAHAEAGRLAVDYRFTTTAALAASGARFEAVLSLEVVEHVPDRRAFIGECCDLVAPGGVLIVATLNRTLKAFLFGIVGAEYVLRWLPVGTHRWDRFVRPSELAADLRRAGFRLAELKGVSYNPLTDRFALGSDTDVNYLATAVRAGGAED